MTREDDAELINIGTLFDQATSQAYSPSRGVRLLISTAVGREPITHVVATLEYVGRGAGKGTVLALSEHFLVELEGDALPGTSAAGADAESVSYTVLPRSALETFSVADVGWSHQKPYDGTGFNYGSHLLAQYTGRTKPLQVDLDQPGGSAFHAALIEDLAKG